MIAGEANVHLIVKLVSSIHERLTYNFARLHFKFSFMTCNVSRQSLSLAKSDNSHLRGKDYWAEISTSDVS